MQTLISELKELVREWELKGTQYQRGYGLITYASAKDQLQSILDRHIEKGDDK